MVFAGTPQFALPTLEMLLRHPSVDLVGVVSQPDRRRGRGMRLSPSPVKQAACKAGIDCITPAALRDDEASLAWLRAKRPDLLVVVAFGMLLPRPWLEAPAIAPVNLHASLLPRWRGAAPIERALLAGDRTTGVSLMRMEQGLDTGPVYARRRCPITGRTTGEALRRRLAGLAAGLLADELDGLLSGGRTPEPQPEEGVCYAARIRPEERNIDWSGPARMVDRVVRCFALSPGARCRIVGGPSAGRWLKVLDGLPGEGGRPAGRAVPTREGALEVGCGGGGVFRITRLQPEGRAAMDAAAFCNGLRGEALQLG